MKYNPNLHVRNMPYDHDVFISMKERDTDDKIDTEVTDLGGNWALVVDKLNDDSGYVDLSFLGDVRRESPIDQPYIDRAEGILFGKYGEGAEYHSAVNKGDKYADLYETADDTQEGDEIDHDLTLVKQAIADGWVVDESCEYEWDFDKSLMCEVLRVYGCRVLRSDLGSGNNYERGDYRYFVPERTDDADTMIRDWETFEGYGDDWDYIGIEAKLYFEGVKVGEESLWGVDSWAWGKQRQTSDLYHKTVIRDLVSEITAKLPETISQKIDETTKSLTPFNEQQFERQIQRIASLQLARQTPGHEIMRRANVPLFNLMPVDLWELHSV